MIKKKKVIKFGTLALIIFTVWIYYIMYTVTAPQMGRLKTFTEIIEEEIKAKFTHLPDKYRTRALKVDPISDNFVKSITQYEDYNVLKLWKEITFPINKTKLYVINGKLGTILRAMKETKITHADLNTKGTQLKFLLTLEGGQKVIFKPKRYEKEEVIEGVVYAGKDRYGSEILGFYLSGLLNQTLVPVSVERKIDVKKEIIPVGSEDFLKTTFSDNNRTCIYGICYYCTIKDPVCADVDGNLSGAVIYYVNYKFKAYKNPWRRTYKKNFMAPWETDKNYCKVVFRAIVKHRILDLIDVSVLDFLIQNGDRHHYEVYYDTLVWLDNGKGLGNPYVDHIDILAPLYQCCIIRATTWTRLQQLSGGALTENLKRMPDIENFMSPEHFDALERRLLLIYATIDVCKSEKRLNIIK